MRRTVATAVVAAGFLTACTGGSGHPAGPAGNGTHDDRITADTVPDRHALDRLAGKLPADPVDAAQQLVDTAFAADFPVAVAAVGELLLRAGIPLVSASGPVVALPTGHVIDNVPVDVEMLPWLARGLRSAVVFTPDQVAAMLQLEGGLPEPLTGPEVVGALAEWGKGPDAPAEVVSAGATVRATAAARHELLTPGAIVDAKTLAAVADHPDQVPAQTLSRTTATGGTVDLDPLQAVLLVAHAGSEVATGVRVGHGAPAQPGAGHSFLAATGGSPCDYLDTSKAPGGKEVGDLAKSVTKKLFRGWLKKAVEQRWGKKAAKKLGTGLKRLDNALDVATIVLLQLGAKLEVSADKPTTHFRHDPSEDDRNVKFTATASFSSALAQKRLPCWAMAGISLPPNGPLAGYTVRWAMRGEPQVLRVENDNEDMITDGAKTDSDGRTPPIETYPRRELSPPAKGASVPEQTVTETVTASLDKDDFAIHLKDLFGAGAAGLDAPLYLAYQMAVNLAKRGVLPITELRMPVTYHGQNPYVIRGNGAFVALYSTEVGLTADFYSCAGAAGPWNGTASQTGSSAGLLESVSGGNPHGGSATEKYKATFRLAPDSWLKQQVAVHDKFGLVIELDPRAIKETERSTTTISDRYDRLSDQQIVGEGSWVLSGTDARDLTGFIGKFLSHGLTFHVIAVQREPRCPGASIWDDPFDPS